MVEAQAQSLKELFRDFLRYLDYFLQRNDLSGSEKIYVMYVQEPVEITGGWSARGVVQIWGEYYTFEVTFDKDLKTVDIESEAFYFHLKIDEVEEFLKSIGVVS